MGRPAPDELLERIAESTAVLDQEAAGAAAPATQVVVDGIEVTQAVQDHLNSVPLVARRRTVARVYLSYAGAPIAVRGELRVGRSPTGPWVGVAPIGPAALDPARAGSSLAALLSRRHDLGLSLNFLLPAAMTAAGQTWIRLGSVRTVAGAALPLRPRPATRVRFSRGAPLRVHVAKVRYTRPGSTTSHLPSALDIDLIRSWLRRAYPVATVRLSTTTIDAPHAAPFAANEINALLIALRATDVAAGTDERTHYYGLVADSGGFMRGQASDIPSTPAPGTVASGPAGPSSFGWDTDGGYGDWYTGHELGHTFGRFHAEFCGAVGGAPYPYADGQLSNADGRFVGLDVGDAALALPMRALPGTAWHDVMSYCGNQWLSAFTYRGLRDRLTAENALGAGASAGAALAAPADAVAGMRVVAAANATRPTGTLTAVLPTASEPTPPDESPGREPFSLALTTARGRTLLEQPVAFRPGACELPGEDVTGTIEAVLPALPEASRLELRHGAQVLDARPVGGGTAPRAGAAAPPPPARASVERAGDEVVVTWDAPAAGPARRYLVQASEDDGATWRTVGLELTQPSVRIDPDDFAGRGEIALRIVATDGAEQEVVAQERIPLSGG